MCSRPCRALDKTLMTRYALGMIAGWSSQAARWAHNPKVAGSNPAPATLLKGSRTCGSRTLFFFLCLPAYLIRPVLTLPQDKPTSRA